MSKEIVPSKTDGDSQKILKDQQHLEEKLVNLAQQAGALRDHGFWDNQPVLKISTIITTHLIFKRIQPHLEPQSRKKHLMMFERIPFPFQNLLNGTRWI